jgi:hypothetical protein
MEIIMNGCSLLVIKIVQIIQVFQVFDSEKGGDVLKAVETF